jgi:Ca2+-binding EF-hand superfamily protein
MFRTFLSFTFAIAFAASAAFAEDAQKQTTEESNHQHYKHSEEHHRDAKERYKELSEHSKDKIINVEELFKNRDKNGDGKLSKEEFLENAPEDLKKFIEKRFDVMDADEDGFVTIEEMKTAFEKYRQRHEKHDKDDKTEKEEKVERSKTVENDK